MIDHAKTVVSNKCIYSTNSSTLHLFEPVQKYWQYVTPCAEGINKYKSYDSAVWMCSMLPHSKEVAIYRDVFGEHIDTDTIATARSYEAAYQFIMRTNMRDYTSTQKVTVVAWDFWYR